MHRFRGYILPRSISFSVASRKCTSSFLLRFPKFQSSIQRWHRQSQWHQSRQDQLECDGNVQEVHCDRSILPCWERRSLELYPKENRLCRHRGHCDRVGHAVEHFVCRKRRKKRQIFELRRILPEVRGLGMLDVVVQSDRQQLFWWLE